MLAALAFWQWSSAGTDFLASQNDPSANASYYKPLLALPAKQRPEAGPRRDPVHAQPLGGR